MSDAELARDFMRALLAMGWGVLMTVGPMCLFGIVAVMMDRKMHRIVPWAFVVASILSLALIAWGSIEVGRL